MDVTPEPTEEEAAAIVAALETVRRPAVAVVEQSTPRWRWSGRWWSKPIPLRRNRPW
jgi:hypothetical protein